MYNYLFQITGKLSLLLALIWTIWQFVVKKYLDAKITYKIKLENDKLLEDYRSQELKRQKAVLVSNLLSQWYISAKISENHEKNLESILKLNQLAFEAYLWLPRKIALKLTKILSRASDAPNFKEVIVDTREWILYGDKLELISDEEKLKMDEIIHFEIHD